MSETGQTNTLEATPVSLAKDFSLSRHTAEIVLIGRDGKEVACLGRVEIDNLPNHAWMVHNGKWYGFGVGKLTGEVYYYEAEAGFAKFNLTKA